MNRIFYLRLDRHWSGYVVVVAATVVAVLARIALDPALHARQPFVFAHLVIIGAALYFGLGPALLGLALSLVVSVPLFISPSHTLELNIESVVSVLSYALVSVVIIWLAHLKRLAKEQLAKLNAELEDRVCQRTAELEAANAELAGFTFSIAHDMRQYLRGINVATTTVLQTNSSQFDEDAQFSIESLGRNARQAAQLVNGLLEFSRLGKDQPRKTSVDITSLARDVAHRISQVERATTLHFTVDEGLSALADPHLIHVVLQNLIENAAKYREPDAEPHIHVGAKKCDDATAFFVRDDGIGFDTRFSHKIFEPFQRLHRDVEFPGTGIGLANVKRIVEKHGGSVWAESMLGEGSTFYFTLSETAPSIRTAA